MTDAEKIRAHWDAQAALGAKSGTRDLILKQLEQRFLAPYLAKAERVLDAGCGDGATLRALAWARHTGNVWTKLVGFDYSANMVRAAHHAPDGDLVVWHPHSLLDAIPDAWGKFDLVFTERALINLTSWEEQARAIRHLQAAVAPGGLLVLVENSGDALVRLNVLRRALDLPAIEPPWHNRYFREADVWAAFSVDEPIRFTDAYYFLSRVVNAKLARDEGREPDYDAPVNRLALALPPETDCGKVGQTVAWTWRAPA